MTQPVNDMSPRVRRGLLQAPELNVAIFSFLLNFVWEIWQAPFFAGMTEASHWAAVQGCTQATAGDVTMMLAAFWIVALVTRSRTWILSPGWQCTTGFTAIGFVMTVLMEWLATGPLNRWAYADSMPIVPFLGIGLLPALQWLLLPPLVVWFTRRQIK